MSQPKQIISKLSDSMIACHECGELSPVGASWELQAPHLRLPTSICNKCAVEGFNVKCVLCEGTGEIFNAGVYIACPDCKEVRGG